MTLPRFSFWWMKSRFVFKRDKITQSVTKLSMSVGVAEMTVSLVKVTIRVVKVPAAWLFVWS